MRCVVNHCFHRSKLTIRFARGGHSEFGKNLPKGKMQWRADTKYRTHIWSNKPENSKEPAVEPSERMREKRTGALPNV